MGFHDAVAQSGFRPPAQSFGAENVRLNASLIGLSGKRTEMFFNDIVDFAELQDAIDEPLRTYSTGMAMRLAFAVAIQAELRSGFSSPGACETQMRVLLFARNRRMRSRHFA